jgi:prepilin-type N-terminal cleavage/methylation domain-containing protein
MILKKGFTLIELMIVITIIWILFVWVFVPYNLYSNIAKVKAGAEIITQAINEARFSAMWIQNTTNKNVNIWIVLEKQKNEIKILSYPFDYTWNIKSDIDSTLDIQLFKTIKLEDWINLNKIERDGTYTDDIIIIYFTAPNWDLSFYKWWESTVLTTNKIWITIWFKESVDWVLSRLIEIKK